MPDDRPATQRASAELVRGLGLLHRPAPRQHPGYDARWCPIVTISFGETRVFRLNRGSGQAKETRDFVAANGSVFVLPYDTNLAWKQAVPREARYRRWRLLCPPPSRRLR